MIRLFLEFNLRSLLRRPAAFLATIAAIGVGVGVILAVDLASGASVDAFFRAVSAIGGRVTHEVRGGALGVPEEEIPRISRLKGVSAAGAVIEGLAFPAEGVRRPLLVQGVDLFALRDFVDTKDGFKLEGDAFERLLSKPATVALPERTAHALAVGIGDHLTLLCGGKRVSVEVLAILDDRLFGRSSEDRVLTDVSTAQEIFDRLGFVDRVDLILSKEISESDCSKALGPGLSLATPERRAGSNASLTESFRMNLLALSLLATFVGAYLAFNAAEYSVAIRRRSIAQARCSGARRRDVLWAFLIEAGLSGVLGGILGVVIGAVLAPLALDAVAATTSGLYTSVTPDAPELKALPVLRAFAIGLLASVSAAFFPARDAAMTAPAEALSRAPEERRFATLRPRLVFATLFGIGVAVLAPMAPGTSTWWGYVAVAGVLVASAAATPLVAFVFLRGVGSLGHRAESPIVAHAAFGLQRDLARTGASLAALATALAMTLGIVTMVGSFRETVKLWLDQILEADVYVGPFRAAAPFDPVALPSDLIEALKNDQDAAVVDVLRGGGITLTDGSRAFLAGVDARATASRWWYVGGADAEATKQALLEGACIVSESFARRRGMRVGESLTIPGRASPVEFRIAAIFRDYSVDAGYIAVDQSHYERAFGRVAPRGAAIRVKKGASATEVARRLQADLGARHPIRVRANSELKADALATFERTFQVTTFLRGIAIAMAFLGVFVALFARALSRGRETATLRAIGLTRKRAVFLAALQGALFVLPPAALGVIGGALISILLTDVVNVRAFGWSLVWDYPLQATLVVILIAIAMGALASVLPVRRLLRMSPAAGLREE